MKFFPLVALCCVIGMASCTKNDDVSIDPPQKITDTLPGTISSDMTLDASKDYVVNGRVFVNGNASLTIPAGVTVYMVKNDAMDNKSSLIIAKGSKIMVNGTVDKPVVMTSAADVKAPGDWGALIILGNAPTNTGTGYVAGLEQTDNTKYGGTDAADNSGSISYLRLDYAGGINPDAEDEWAVDKASGFYMASVGSATVVNNVMVTHSRDDGFQFVGGTFNATNLIAFNNGDDDFDFDLGYTGRLQFLISYRTSLSSNHALRANGFESYNDEVPTLKAPLTRPIISNFTVIGPQGNNGAETNLNQGIYIRKGTRFVLENSLIAEYPKGGLMVCNKTRPVLLNNTGSLFKNNIVQSDTLARTFSWDKDYAVFGDSVLRDFALNEVNKNTLVENSADLQLTAMYDATNGPNLVPATGSPALSGADFSEEDLSSGFSVVTYRGAIGTTNWAAASNWAKWSE